ncbi:hypothetical protein HZS_2495, partial [Henneguya salminicola]
MCFVKTLNRYYSQVRTKPIYFTQLMPYLLTDDINALIFQYLKESVGFIHSSFTFAYESGIDSCSNLTLESASKLVDLVQKGIYFTEIETLADKLSDTQQIISNNIPIENSIEFYSKAINNIKETVGKINAVCWGPKCSILTGHTSGACVKWNLDINPAKSESLSFKLHFTVEPLTNKQKCDVICVEHIPNTDNFCCGTSSGLVKVFNEQGSKITYQDFQTSVWASSAWIGFGHSHDPFVAFGSIDGTCVLRQGPFLTNVQCIQNFAGFNLLMRSIDCISESSWSKSGVLALSSLDGSISFLNPLTSSPPIAVNLHKSINRMLLIYIEIYSKSNIDNPYEITCHKCEITSIKWINNDEDILVSVDINSNLYFHIFDSYYKKWKSSHLYLYSLPVKCIEIVQKDASSYVLVGSQDGHLLIIDYKNKEIYKSFRLPFEIIDFKMNDSGFLALRYGNGQVLFIFFCFLGLYYIHIKNFINLFILYLY